MPFGITAHQVKVFVALYDATDEWQDPKEIEATTGVCLRTCHRHLEAFVDAGLVEKKSIFPKHYFRLVFDGALTAEENAEIDKLTEAAKILRLL